MESKHKFEREARSVGISVKAYNTDNGVFTAKDFMDQLLGDEQQVRRSGVGAHHQNGVAEVNIKHTSAMARTMLIHAALRWPSATDKML